eukprot:TRINITY_DN2658_c0_g1_i1.p1 TRINITY_DN2658_c0_g1~~TRINITY_DN2658_c0_g1_i1.p1  ORF type:complete len:2482 (+),score=553.97 TRINITY_DN2658_c0_g1_i1:113-7558(+)
MKSFSLFSVVALLAFTVWACLAVVTEATDPDTYCVEIAESFCSLACTQSAACETKVKQTCNADDSKPYVNAFTAYRIAHKWDSCGGTWCSPCNGHGTCNNGVCTCDADYKGADCSEPVNPPVCKDDCNEHGVCTQDGVCHCDAGYTGQTCEEYRYEECCPNGCSNHGTCETHGTCSCDAGYYGADCSYKIPPNIEGAHCWATGDPHYVTWDGYHYSLQGKGVYYLVHSEEFKAQEWHRPYVLRSGVSINRAVAFLYKDQKVELYTTNPYGSIAAYIDGNLVIPGDAFQKVGGVEIRRLAHTGRQLEVLIGTSIHVHVSAYTVAGKEDGLQTHIQVPEDFYNQVGGLCGTFDRNAKNELRLRDGSTVVPISKLYTKFAPSWRVPCDEVLFHLAPPSSCAGVEPVEPKPPGHCHAVEGLAEEVCKLACLSYQQCVFDVHATCDLSAADAHIQQFQLMRMIHKWDKCGGSDYCQPCSGHGTCGSNGQCTCDMGWRVEGDCSVEEDVAKCPNDCSNHGFCIYGECRCKAGYGGADCSQEQTVACPGGCEHGKCLSNGVCECTNGYYGVRCEKKLPAHPGPGVCTSTGDPHVHTFDGGYFSYQNAGTYRLIHSDELEVQAWAVKYTPTARVRRNNAIVLRYRGSMIEVYAPDKSKMAPLVRLNDAEVTLSKRWATTIDLQARVVKRTNAYSQIEVNLVNKDGQDWRGVFTMYVYVKQINFVALVYPGWRDRLHGLCGYYDGNRANDYMLLDGTVVPPAQLFTKFLPEYAVDCEASLFKYQPPGECVVHDPTDDDEVVHSAPCPELLDVATVACKHACMTYAECLYDVYSTCNIEFADQHKIASDELSALWGTSCDALCEMNCHGNGLCNPDGSCVCGPGWTGNDCSIPVCSKDCSVHGLCMPGDRCCCDHGHYGETCESTKCPNTNDCNGHGDCIGVEECQCYDDPVHGHWKDVDCTSCKNGYYGTECKYECPGGHANPCNGHGVCVDGIDGSGICKCGTSYSGDACEFSYYDVDPMVECVVQKADGSYEAFFGYDNKNPTMGVIEHGEFNAIVPSTMDNVFPENFGIIGRTLPFPNAPITVPFAAHENVAWKLGDAIATASTATQYCPVDPSKLQPILQCVSPHTDGTYTAFFGYTNNADYVIHLSVGALNRFTYGSEDIGQPTVFQPGTLGMGAHSVAVIFMEDEEVTWVLGGGSVTASKTSGVCNNPLCPNNCLGEIHGRCVAGVCECTNEYMGYDCSIPRESVSPSLFCVGDLGDGLYTAYFGYTSTNTMDVVIPKGTNNQFIPDPKDRGQPIEFHPGASDDFPKYAVSTTFASGESVMWRIGTGSALANHHSKACVPSRPVKPVLQCVEKYDDNGSISFDAFFGYQNLNPYEVDIAIGASNVLSPDAIDGGQISHFHVGIVHSAFRVFSEDGSALTWTINGLSAEATAESRACGAGHDGPKINLARLSNDLLSIEIRFSEPTNRGGMTSSTGLCSGILTPSVMSRIGNDATCTWSKNDRFLTVTLLPTSSIVPGDLIEVLPLIRNRQETSGLCTTSTHLLQPKKPLSPKAVIVGPVELSYFCDHTLYLDGTQSSGAGGRELSYEWTVVSQPANDLPAFVGNDPFVKETFDALTSGKYKFRLKVTNFGGGVDTDVHVIQVSKEKKVPLIVQPKKQEVELTDPTRRVYIKSHITVANCLNNSTDVTYKWTQGLGPSVQMYRTDSSRMYVIEGDLKESERYRFDLEVALVDDPSVKGSAQAVLVTLANPMVVHIVGQTLYRGLDTIELEALVSGVVDMPEAFLYEWTCTEVDTSLPCKNTSGDVIVFPKTSFLTYDIGHFMAPPGEEDYYFSCIVHYAQRSAYDSLHVKIEKGERPLVTIVPPESTDPTAKIVVKSSVSFYEQSNGVQYDWHIKTYPDLVDITNSLSLPNTQSKYLTIPKNTLGNDVTYVLTLSVTDKFGTGNAQHHMHTSRPPSGGRLKVRPQHGYALETTFEMMCVGWADPQGLPLRYRFMFIHDDHDVEEIPLSPWTDENSIGAELPNPKNGQTLTIVAYIANTDGAAARVTKTIEVEPQTINCGAIMRQLIEMLWNALAFGRDDLILQLLSAIVDSMTCLEPNDLVFIRQEIFAILMQTTSCGGLRGGELGENVVMDSGSSIAGPENILNLLAPTTRVVKPISKQSQDDPISVGDIDKAFSTVDNILTQVRTTGMHVQGGVSILQMGSNVLHAMKGVLPKAQRDKMMGQLHQSAILMNKMRMCGEDDESLRMDGDVSLLLSSQFTGAFSNGRSMTNGTAGVKLPSSFSKIVDEGECIGSYAMNFVHNPYKGEDSRTNIVSNVFGFSVHNVMGEGIPVAGLKEDIEVRIPAQNVTEHQKVSCVYWEDGGWRSSGCSAPVYEAETHSFVCRCNHLTDFAVKSVLPDNKDDSDDGDGKSGLYLVVLFSVVGVVCIGVVITLLVRRVHHHQERRESLVDDMEMMIEASRGLVGASDGSSGEDEDEAVQDVEQQD